MSEITNSPSRVYKNHSGMRELHARESRKKIRARERKHRKDYRAGKIRITVGHFYSVVCELFNVEHPDPQGFLKRLNDFYKRSSGHCRVYFPDILTVFHNGLVTELENFLYHEFGHEPGTIYACQEKRRIAVMEALGNPFGEHPLTMREDHVDYTTIENVRREKRLASKKPA
ncbi:MAG: hypothetical protein HGA67_03705 [Candidatus Yonathbacteria bacterium]|nr:hypothetical protein [Candidatus Yonathbacteria bacterium]